MNYKKRNRWVLVLAALMLIAYAALLAPEEAFASTEVETVSGTTVPVTGVIGGSLGALELPEAALESSNGASLVRLPAQGYAFARMGRTLGFAGLLLALAVLLFVQRLTAVFSNCRYLTRFSLDCVHFIQAQHGPKDGVLLA